AVQFEQLWVPVALLALLTGVQQFIGLFLEPVVAGQRLDLSPLVIVLSLAFWGVVWGIPGMILAVPLVVIVKTVLDNIPATAPAGHLLSKV
ncbi:MAG TPA: AI-2E family transporter, partial [Gemmataceae bacterium]